MNKFKAAIIGCGSIFDMHANSIAALENVELIAVCDNNPERSKQKAKQFNCKYYLDYMQMVEKEQLDVVHICLPHYLHAPAAIYAAKAKVNVLTEKPMAIDLNAAEQMVESAKTSGVNLGVIFQNRYNQASILIKDTLSSGALGKILGGKCCITWRRTKEYYSADPWRGTWDMEGGGVIINQAIHTLDLMRWFIDSEIEYIQATMANRVIKTIEVEDFAEGIITYKNGVISSFYALNYHSYDAPVEIELHCEKGMIKMVGERASIKFYDGRELIADRNPNETFNYGDGKKGYWGVGHQKQIGNFYDALEKGIAPDITGEEAVKTQKVICEIYESGRKNFR
jgi:UDP-N-acetyl-2-amino-2-deoxyglucuronate dehydrogenase